MKPMTLYESLESNGKILLNDIVNGKRDIDGIQSSMTYEKFAYLICRGGWPASLDIKDDYALEIPKEYIEAVCKTDISRVDGVSRDSELARTILKSYARQVCSVDSNEALYQDVMSNHNVSKNTIIAYLNALKKLMLFEEIEAWNPNIRSKTTIRTSPKKTL